LSSREKKLIWTYRGGGERYLFEGRKENLERIVRRRARKRREGISRYIKGGGSDYFVGNDAGRLVHSARKRDRSMQRKRREGETNGMLKGLRGQGAMISSWEEGNKS